MPRHLALLLVVLCLAIAATIFLLPASAARFFSHSTPVLELATNFASGEDREVASGPLGTSTTLVLSPQGGTGTEPGNTVQTDFWAHSGGGYLLEVSAEASDAGFELFGREDSQSEALSTLASVRLRSTGDRYWALLSAPKFDGSAILKISNRSDQDLQIQHLVLTKVSGLYFLLRTLSTWLSVLLLGLVVVRAWEQHRHIALSLCLFVAAFWVYSAYTLPGRDNRSDNELYVPTALSLLSEGNLELSEYQGSKLLRSKQYRTFRRGDQVFNRYPMGTPIVTAPLVAIGHYLKADESRQSWRRIKTADFVADVLAAMSVVLVFLVLAKLGAGTKSAAFLALLFAFTTPHWPTHGGGLWSSNLATLLLLMAVFSLLYREGRYAWASSLPLVLAIATRPTAVLLVPFVGLFLLRQHYRHYQHSRHHKDQRARQDLLQVMIWLILMAAGAAALLLSCKIIYGNYLPPYYGRHLAMLSSSRFARAFAGLLISPNRGLFVFCPLFLLSLWGGALTIKREPGPTTDLLRLFALYCLGYVFFVATFKVWWGGGSYGPRLLAEMFPFLVFLLLPWLESVRHWQHRKKVAAIAMFSTLTFLGLFAAYRGATEVGTRSWNRWPKRLDQHQERLWDWHDLQILRTRTGRPSSQ